jgi:hypothetical protein
MGDASMTEIDYAQMLDELDRLLNDRTCRFGRG